MHHHYYGLTSDDLVKTFDMRCLHQISIVNHKICVIHVLVECNVLLLIKLCQDCVELVSKISNSQLINISH